MVTQNQHAKRHWYCPPSRSEASNSRPSRNEATNPYRPLSHNEVTNRYCPPSRNEATNGYYPPSRNEATNEYCPPSGAIATNGYGPPSRTEANYCPTSHTEANNRGFNKGIVTPSPHYPRSIIGRCHPPVTHTRAQSAYRGCELFPTSGSQSNGLVLNHGRPNCGFICFYHKKHPYVLNRSTELYDVLDELCYSDQGKSEVLVELKEKGLLLMRNAGVLGCVLDNGEFPGHLRLVRDKLLLGKTRKKPKIPQHFTMVPTGENIRKCNPGMIRFQHNGICMRLSNDTELYGVLDKLGYSDQGKSNVLVELNFRGLLLLDGDYISGCATDEHTFPGPLCLVKDTLDLYKNLRKKKKSELLLSRAKSMAILREKRKRQKLFNSTSEASERVDGRQTNNYVFGDDTANGEFNYDDGGTIDQCDSEILSYAPITTVAMSESKRTLAVTKLTRKKCLFLGMAWVMADDVTLPDLLVEANTKQNWALCPYRDAARMLKASEFGFDDIFSLDRKVSPSLKHFVMDLSCHERSADFERLRTHRFVEISLDFVWMPTAYISETVLKEPFYSSMLLFLSDILEDLGCIYIPAHLEVFRGIARNWKALSDVFLLRYIREDQVEESALFRATLAVPMEKLGKEGAHQQIKKFGLCVEAAKKVPGATNELLSHHPGNDSTIRFLCLSRIRRQEHIGRYDPLSKKYIDYAQRRGKLSKQALSLCEESMIYLSRTSFPIKSINVGPATSPPSTIQSPFHQTYLEGGYGEGRSGATNTPRVAIQKFVPGSVGELKLPPHGWACLKCSSINESSRSLHVCRTCSSTPQRIAKLNAKVLTTSKYLLKESDESDNEEISLSTSSDYSDEGFCLRDERSINKQRELNEYGRRWTIKDTKHTNEHIYRMMSSQDDPPKHTDSSTLWSTVICSPLLPGMNGMTIGKNFQLDNRKSLQGILQRVILAVQKNKTQLVCCFNLDRCPHAVMGVKGMESFAQLLQGSVVYMKNEVDHVFDPKYPDRPLVCNTDSIRGIVDGALFRTVGFSRLLLELSLRQQVQMCLDQGLQEHAEEFIKLATFDTRGTMSFHAGPSPREGTRWKRRNGVGIAVPGLRERSLPATKKFRQWLLHLQILISHQFLETYLEGTMRNQQAIPDRYRLEQTKEWRKYLGCPNTTINDLRLGDGLSLNAGSVGFHLDHMNDSRTNHDQITWGLIHIPTWKKYLSSASILQLKKYNVSSENTAFTALMYGRAIVGSQAEKEAGIINVNCPLFQTCVSLIKDEEFPLDFNLLKEKTSRDAFTKLLLSSKVHGPDTEFDYKQYYATVLEGNNRFIFLGSFAYAWMRFLECYPGKVQLHHCYEYVAFVMRECNGSPLLVQVMDDLISPTVQVQVLNSLSNNSPSLYVLLSQRMRKHRPHGGLIVSTACRWQNYDKPVWSSTADDAKTIFLVDFISSQFQILATNPDKIECEAACRLLSSNLERKRSKRWSDEKLEVIKMGAVRATFGIQLAAYLLLIPAKWASYATIEKGKSGFYKCVNTQLCEMYEKNNITSQEAQEEVDGCIQSLVKSGFPVTWARMDQNCCYYARKYYRKGGNDGRKKDVIFFESNGQVYLPMRSKTYKNDRYEIQFFVMNEWYNLAEWWKPGYEMNGGGSVLIKTRMELAKSTKERALLKPWVRNQGIDASIASMRRILCRQHDGSNSLF